MMDKLKCETFKNFTILNKALLFLIKLIETAAQSVPKTIQINFQLDILRSVQLAQDFSKPLMFQS